MDDRVCVKRKALEAVVRQCQLALQQLSSSCDDGVSNDVGVELDDAQVSLLQNLDEEGSSWEMVSVNDLWVGAAVDLETENYVLVREEDIMEAISAFVAEYLLSLEQTKYLTPNQLREALGKTLAKKKKGKLRKAWDRSRVVYNVASWGTTAIGIYQNPALLAATSAAFQTSCTVIAKLL